MRAFLCVATVALLALGGCMGLSGDDGGAPRTREFTFVVPAGTDRTIELYEKNGGEMMRVVFVGFETPGQDSPRLPNPEIRVQEGDTVILHVLNENQLGHTFHLHGGLIPWEQDGVDFLTQFPIMPGEEHTYTFPDLKAGTYWYHCHADGAHHIDLGMYGAFIVEERNPSHSFDREYVVMLDEADTCHVHGNTDPITNQEESGSFQNGAQCYYRFLLDNLAQNRIAQTTASSLPDPVREQACGVLAMLPEEPPEANRTKQQLMSLYGCAGEHAHSSPPLQQAPREWWYETMPVYAPLYNAYLVNGKAFPDTPVFAVEEGERVLFRLINAGGQVHTWHPHGHNVLVTHKDGYGLSAPYRADTLAIAPGERYDVILGADNPGLWMVHDQNGLAMMNDDQHPGGMMSCIAYDGFHGVDAFAMERALDCNHEGVRILGEMGHVHGG
ncbi:MAG TPA: multicopper oxidase domain-containing protein [Candidatus Thermoplasmatota archaeon]|nr:multicopper oxidase domain-containing protein [Candidatus Thermoplasmatota archaeon]